MQTPAPADDPLKAYQASLEKNGLRRGEILKRMHMARCIIGCINAERPTVLSYREVVDTVLDTMPDAAATELCRQVARDFFPFLVHDPRASGASGKAGGDGGDIRVSLPEHRDLDDLIRLVREMPFSTHEYRVLSNYGETLLSQRMEPQAVETRATICRLLLTGMRGLPLDGRHYRAVVDRLLALFRRDETRIYFLNVAREFFEFMVSQVEAT